MFYHSKELQFKARVSRPDPRFARLLLEQFGGGNGELKAAMQYFVQAFACHNPYPDKYDMLMDIATEELGHLEIVGATIQMLLAGVNGNLKDAAEQPPLTDRLPLDAVVHYDRYKDYTDAEIDELWAEKEASPETSALLAENGLPNLAQIFTRNRYRREDNIAISRAYFELLREQGFFNQ